MPEPLVIERDAELDLDVHELWTLISTSQGWSSWLVDHADIAVVTDATGTAVDDGVERTVHIDSVTEGRAIGFSWWTGDDPSSVSAVRLDIVELPEGRSLLHITERFIGSSVSAAASCSTAVTWDVRILSLCLLALPCIVMV